MFVAQKEKTKQNRSEQPALSPRAITSSRPQLLLRAMSGTMVLLQPWPMLTSVAPITTEDSWRNGSLNALPDDMSPVPRTHLGQLPTACNSRATESNTLFRHP